MFNASLASVDYLPIGYIVTDVNHNVLLINYAARKLLTEIKTIKKLEQVVDKLPKRLVLLDHVKYCSIEHKSCSFREVELGDRVVRIFLSPIFDGPDLRGNLLTLEDITEKVNNEHARDQFLAYLVHEFRTPLTAIHGNSALIRQYYPQLLEDKNLSELVDDITTGSTYMLQMVNQFLDMSRLEEGRITYAWQQLDAVKLIAETVQGLDVLAKNKGLTFQLKMPDNLSAAVVGDPERIKQVLTNFVGNAIKFTEQGDVTVDLEKTDSILRVSVTDTGPGIPMDSRANMFQKYFQASNNKLKADSSKSTGLGLYVTKLIMEGMGNQIALIRSEVGKGSTFSFTLDLDTPERLKLMAKQIADQNQGVQHAHVEDHASISIAHETIA
jgi:signal transduction histidine kinase